MIKIDSISKNFDAVKSLREVSLCVDNGSIFGLIGSNGSGKSTLLRIICGIYKPSEGDILFDGAPVWENPGVKERIVYLSDEQYFIPNSTIYEMMKFYKCIYPSFSEEKYKEYLSIFELDENRKLNTFSKGMQKQASILLGLSCRTDYLLCDETLDGLDPVMRQTVRRIIASEVAERGLTVIFASHNLKELEDICDHIALLHKGELLLESGLDDIKLGIHKIQISFSKENLDEAKRQLDSLDKLAMEQRGSLFTLIVRGDEKQLDDYMKSLNPLFVEFIPLTLDEIFIAEMEERGYEFHENILS
ncbi:MAG: ABC transporter ATP-binding protein [Eubacteriales bacterium]